MRGRLAVIGCFAAGYGLMFCLAWFLVGRIDLSVYLDAIMLFFKSGMTLHFLLAALLFACGATLLKKGHGTATKSRGWILLTLTFPICFFVILLGGVFLRRLLPDIPWLFAWFSAGFITVSLASGITFSFTRRNNPKYWLGAVMMLATLYFLLAIAVVPQFGDIERIYRLSMGSVTTLSDGRLPLLLTGISLAFTAGFLKTIWRPSWK